MRVVILTSNDIRHAYFCLSLIKSFNVVGIIQEPKGPRKDIEQNRKTKSRNKITFSFIMQRIIARLYGQYMINLKNEKKNIEFKYFKNALEEFKKQYHKLIISVVDKTQHNSMNDAHYVEKLYKLKPDAIAVMGTSILKKEILSIAEYNFNMHTGLSPYYRGGRTNFWPIRNKEAQYCGVTIHKLSLGIDSGDIIYHGLPVINKEDSFPNINCKSIILGTELIKQSLQDLQRGKLCTKKQWTKGKLFFNKHFNGWHVYRYYRIIERGFIKKYVHSVKEEQIDYPEGLVLYTGDNLPQFIPRNYR